MPNQSEEGYNASLSGITDIKELTATPDEDKKTKNISAIVLMIFSAIIFLTLSAMYNLIQNILETFLIFRMKHDPECEYTHKEISRKLRKTYNNIMSNIVYCFLMTVLTILAIFYLSKYM
jgi:hypothetical protein